MPSSPSLDRLRLAAALVHRLPGCRLVLRCAGGSPVTVGRHHGDDLDPCQFRRAVAASSFPGASDLGGLLAVEAVTGVQDHGGGLLGTTCERHVSRWFATLLDPERTREVLAAVAEVVPEDGIDAGLGVDRQLAVTVVRITAWDQGVEEALDRIARLAVDACLIEEVIEGARRDGAPARPRPARRTDRP